LSVGVLAASVGEVRAAIVAQWNFTLDSAFDLTQTTDDTGVSPGGVSATGGTINPFWGSPSSIWWGGAGNSPPNVSGITVGNTDVTGGFQDPGPHTSNGVGGPGTHFGDHGGAGDGAGVTTGGGFIPTVQFTHHNATIPIGPSLAETVLLDRLVLTPFAGGVDETLFLAFDIQFTETPNGGPGSPDDIFVLTPQGGLAFDGNVLSQGFTYDSGDGVDQPYLAQLRLAGLEALSNEECEAAGAAAGCMGLVTQEGLNNTFLAELAITAVPIPPAGVLFLSALAGLGLISRRKKAAQPA
jgi:hypothetical protein